jgi:subtilisin family serine protease
MLYTNATQIDPPSWGLDRIDQYTGTDNQYNYQYTGAGVHVYVLDTPIADQAEFTGRFVDCVTFTKEACFLAPTTFHGTHVTGKCLLCVVCSM